MNDRPLRWLPPLLVLGSCLAMLPSLRAQEDHRTALEIFDTALMRTEKRQAVLRSWQYYSTLTTRQYDDDGGIVGKGTWRTLIRPGERDPVQEISESRDGTLTFFEDKPDEKKKKSRRGKEEGEGEDKNQVSSITEAVRKFSLRERFAWTRLPDESVAGEKAFVVRFEPRPGQRTKSREERFFNQLAGRIWLSQEDYSVLKVSGGLQSAYRLFWIIARVTQLEFSYEVLPTKGDRLLRPSRAQAKSTVVFPFSKVRQLHWLSVDKFEPRTPRPDSPAAKKGGPVTTAQ